VCNRPASRLSRKPRVPTHLNAKGSPGHQPQLVYERIRIRAVTWVGGEAKSPPTAATPPCAVASGLRAGSQKCEVRMVTPGGAGVVAKHKQIGHPRPQSVLCALYHQPPGHSRPNQALEGLAQMRNFRNSLRIRPEVGMFELNTKQTRLPALGRPPPIGRSPLTASLWISLD
jgi:hypothetical protein